MNLTRKEKAVADVLKAKLSHDDLMSALEVATEDLPPGEVVNLEDVNPIVAVIFAALEEDQSVFEVQK